MKRLLICLLLAIALSAPLSVGATLLSPAMEHTSLAATVVCSAVAGETIRFTDADIRQALGVTTYPDLTIETLPDPSSGTLRLNGARVAAGQSIPRAFLSLLTFTPSTPFISEARFTLRAGSLCGGAAVTCLLRFGGGENHAPVASAAATTVFGQTRRNVSVFGTLSGYDADGDALTYCIVTYPAHGTLFVTGASTGDFRYTPYAGYTGTDSFTYVVRDAYGAYSAPAEVRIRVDKRTLDLDFDDMDEAANGFAVAMVAAGIMDADATGFRPEEGMSRAAFLVAAMKALGIAPASQSVPLVYDDAAEIPQVLRGYYAAAQEAGWLVGEIDASGRLLTRPEDTVTVGEAYQLLARMAGSEGTCTAAEGYAYLARIARPGARGDLSAPLSRIQAAELLTRLSSLPAW